MTTYDRLEKTAYDAVNSNDATAMNREHVPTLTDSYLQNTSVRELFALRALLNARDGSQRERVERVEMWLRGRVWADNVEGTPYLWTSIELARDAKRFLKSLGVKTYIVHVDRCAYGLEESTDPYARMISWEAGATVDTMQILATC